jgi:glycosyltransferase involved in cell wall biosynthesis
LAARTGIVMLVVDARKGSDAGIGTYVREMVPRVLEKLDVAAAVWVPRGQRDKYKYLQAHTRSIELVEFDAPPFSLNEQWEMRRRLTGEDVLWATSLAHPWRSAQPLIATVHDVLQVALPRAETGASPIARLAFRALLRNLRDNASALMAVSSFTAEEFLRHLGRPSRTEMTVTPLGVDAEWFGARPITLSAGVVKSAPYFACVGSVRPHKNIDRLVTAFGMAAERLPHDMVIAGRLPGSSIQATWLKALPQSVRARVHFTGELTDAAIRDLIQQADALVLPSLYEGFGLPALEAMAAGCPVLSSRAGALPEVCADAAGGWFDPRSVEEMANAMIGHSRMAQTQRHLLVKRGVAHAQAQSWDRSATLAASSIARLLHGAAQHQ